MIRLSSLTLQVYTTYNLLAVTYIPAVGVICSAGPKNAGGASGAIYEYLGIHRDKFFPEPVSSSNGSS